MPVAQIYTLLSIWAASLLQHGGQPLFTNHQDLYNTIDSTPLGNIKWESFSIKYTGKQPITNTPPWMNDTYEVWFRDPHELVCSVLGNPNFANNMDTQPYREFEMATDQHRFINFMHNLNANSLRRCQEHTEALVEEFGPDALWDEYGIVGQLVPFTNNFPCADIYDLLSPNLLHQIIKGSFKDHLVDWVERYLKMTHSANKANSILDDIDRRIAAHFKQWTGDDSKVLMKVYIPTIEGYVPVDVIQAFRAFLEFFYLVHRDIISDNTLDAIQDALNHFHQYREIFCSIGVVLTFSLPQQHSMRHYPALIHQFSAPNGLCSSITESKHIKAVKEPYHRSNHHNALRQMLLCNQRLDKLSATRVDFCAHGMLNGTCLSALKETLVQSNSGSNENANINQALDGPPLVHPSAGYVEDVGGEPVNNPTAVEAHVELACTPQRKRARTVLELGEELQILEIGDMLRQFLYQQENVNNPRDLADVHLNECPCYDGRISLFNSAAATFYAPSDISDITGMHREYIRSCPSWRNGYARLDCAFVTTNPELEGMLGLDIVCILAFFSFMQHRKYYPCAVVCWFVCLEEPDPDTGMWIVHPGLDADNQPDMSIIRLSTIYRAAHLIPVYGTQPVPPEIQTHHSYDVFQAFYINKFADHHAFEITS
ncbi:hypothetical protein BDN67DRAFT_1017603 [Paxillus ammoniavirescens]|nr:hypothetical protein BDN67DRAFT_1017603 [Paxillus ammoniavirescens]